MKLHRRLTFLAIAVLFARSAYSQGAFQNLGFESPSLITIPNDPYNRVQFSAAFPGWVGSVGTVQQSAALYNNAFLDSSGIGIMDQNSSFPPATFLIEGSYTAVLQAGFALGTFQPTDTTLAQSGLIPAGTQSLRFKAHISSLNPANFGLTINGQPFNFASLSNGPGYALYGADISAVAGQRAELAFTVFAENPHVINRYLFLDSIQFLIEPIPEPRTVVLLMLGACLIGIRFMRKPKA